MFGREKKEMPHIIITDECIMCGACEAACPQSAISEIDGFYVINEEKCDDNGACSDVCPTGAARTK